MEKKYQGSYSTKRVMALCVDLLVLGIIALILFGVSSFIGPIWSWVVAIVLFLLYVSIPILAIGQTLGKRIAKIKVVKLNGSTYPKNLLLLREISKYIFIGITCSAYIFICGLMVLFRDDEASIHDMIFKTKTIYLETSKLSKNKEYEEPVSFKL